MLHITRSARVRIRIYLAVLFLAMCICSLPFPLFHSAVVLYGSLFLYWGACVQRRILNPAVRTYLTVMVALMLVLLLVRDNKYVLWEELPEIQLYSWYGYTGAYLGIALCSLLSAFGIDRPDPCSVLRRGAPFLALWGALSLLSMTNNVHQLVYRFAPGTADPFHNYAFAGAYWVIVGTIALFLTASFGIVLYRGRELLPRFYASVPLLVLLVCALYYLVFYLNGNRIPQVPVMINPPEFYCLTLIFFWESCIQIGLLPSCSGYETLVHLSSAGVEILSRDKTVALSQAKPARSGENFLSRERPIHGGFIRWTTDLSTVNALNERLDQSIEKLSEENDLIAAENSLRRRKTRYETQNRLYDEVSRAVRPQTERIEALLRRGPLADVLGQCCVLGAFVKRRANLALLREGAERIPLDELGFCVRETLEYLRLLGVQSALFYPENGGELPAEDVVSAYALFEDAVEAIEERGAALIVHLTADPTRYVHLEIQGGGRSLDSHGRGGLRMEVSRQGETAFATVRQAGRTGGEAE